MLRTLWRRLRGWAERDEDSGFVRSELDASVLEAHGGRTVAQDEITALEEQAEELQDFHDH